MRRNPLLRLMLVLWLAACSADTSHDVAQLGQPLPEVALAALDGKATHASAWRGKLLVLNVWATWCPPCRREIPSLERLSRADPARIAVISLSVDDDQNLLREFLHEHQVSFPAYTDPAMQIAQRLGATILPTTLIIAPDGTLLERVVGERVWHDAQTLAKLQAAYRGDPLHLSN